MSSNTMNQMNTNTPQFAQLSSMNPSKDRPKFKTIRPGHLNDYIKTNPWRTLHNY